MIKHLRNITCVVPGVVYHAPPRVLLNELLDFSDMTLGIENWDNPFKIDFEPIKNKILELKAAKKLIPNKKVLNSNLVT